MKKLIGLLALILVIGGGVANAQYRDYQYPQRDRYERQDDYRRGGRREAIQVRNEYRYVQYGRRVYRETYRSTYAVRQNGRSGTYRERLVNRTLINRVEVSDRDRNYRNDRGRPGFNFNVFLRGIFGN